MSARNVRPGPVPRALRATALASSLAVCVAAAAGVFACDGTTGREGLEMPGTDDDGGTDSSVVPVPDMDTGAFDVTILYADRILPDISAPVEVSVTGPEGATGGGLQPCTTAGQTGCVSCQDNASADAGDAGGICTPTEALLVQHDIARGVATVPGDDPAGSCYACLNANYCLDDDKQDTNQECQDEGALLEGTAAECYAVLSCILNSGYGDAGSSCAVPLLNNCYCGPAAPGTACTMAGSSVNGVCAAPIAAGLVLSLSDNVDILKDLEDTTRAAGIATNIVQCASTNKCAACLN